MEIHELIRRERAGRAWTLAQLAAKSGVSRPTLGRLEHPVDCYRVSLASAAKVLSALGHGHLTMTQVRDIMTPPGAR